MKSIKSYILNEKLTENNRFVWYRGKSQKNNQGILLKVAFFSDIHEKNTILVKTWKREFDLMRRLQESLNLHTIEFFFTDLLVALAINDPGGVILEQHYNDHLPGIEEALEISLSLLKYLQTLSDFGLADYELNPSKFLYHPNSRSITVIDLSGVLSVLHKKDIISTNSLLLNDLYYISPEQTGRINKESDLRSTIYSLGIIFFRIFTGQFPFYSKDASELLHFQIAKKAPDPHTINPSVPPVLSSVILKMLAKSPEERYQTAEGLFYDIDSCYEQYLTNKQIHMKKIAAHDKKRAFGFPTKLYGRDNELAKLVNHVHIASQGKSSVLIITGGQGVGKSSLINEVKFLIDEAETTFLTGSFDSLNRFTPYSAIIQAFRQYLRRLLSQKEKIVSYWKEELSSKLGNSAGILTDLIPELAHFVEHQFPEKIQNPLENTNRIRYFMAGLIQTFCHPQNTIVLLLDNLQWADPASIEFLIFFTQLKTPYFSLIASIREDIFDNVDKIKQWFGSIKKIYGTSSFVNLKSIQAQDVNNFLTDTFNISSEQVLPLENILMKKTGGNPYFIRTFILNLLDKKLIYLKKGWKWNIQKIEQEEITDNMQKISLEQMEFSTDEEKNIMHTMACYGQIIPAKILSSVLDTDENELLQLLQDVLKKELVFYIDDYFKFSHESFREVIYNTLPDNVKIKIHHQLFHTLLELYSEKRSEHIFDIIRHLNISPLSLPENINKLDALKLNIEAASQARASSAYNIANDILKTCESFFQDSFWKNDYSTSLKFFTLQGEMAYLSGEYDRAEKSFQSVLIHAHSILDKISVYELKIILYTVDNRMEKALSVGKDALGILGIHIPLKGRFLHLLPRLISVKRQLRHKNMINLLHLPEMENPVMKAAGRILLYTTIPSYISDPALLPILILTLVGISIKYGNTVSSAYAYVSYGLILAMGLGDIQGGFAFGQLALQLMKKYQAKELQAKVLFIFGNLISHWKDDVRKDNEYLMDAYHSGFETGDLTFASYSINHIIAHSVFSGELLDEASKKALHYQTIISNYKQKDAVFAFNMWFQLIEILRKNEALSSAEIKGDIFNESIILEEWGEKNNFTDLGFYTVAKQFLNILLGHYEELVRISLAGKKYLEGMMGMIYVPEYYFFYSLALLKKKSKLNFSQKRLLAKHKKKFKKWTQTAPQNYLHKYQLIQAEEHRIKKRWKFAAQMYQKSIENAEKNGFLQDKALACEFYSEFFLDTGNKTISKFYLQEAINLYNFWGACTKAEQLIKTHPKLNLKRDFTETFKKTQKVIPVSYNGNISLESLDNNTIFKTSLLIGSEIEMNKLLKNLIRILMQLAGAEKVAMIKVNNDNLTLVAEGNTNSSRVTLFVSQKLNENSFPLSMIRYVLRTESKLIINDARYNDDFGQDNYIRQNKSRSVLVWPLKHHGQLIGLIYLENRTFENVFSLKRIGLLEIIMGQIAVSFENAVLYEQQKEYSKNMEQKVKERTKELTHAHLELQQQHQQIINELEMAKRLQLSIIPKNTLLPNNRLFECAGWYSAMENVGGDLYDFIPLTENRTAFFIADVSGHGVPAALITTMVKVALHSHSSLWHKPSEILKAVNTDIFSMIGDLSYYLTICYGVLDLQKHFFQYAAAGHIPGLYYSHHSKNVLSLRQGGVILGSFKDVQYSDHFLNLSPGDGILLFTDGITDTRNKNRRIFSRDRLIQFLTKEGNRSSKKFLEILKETLETFSGDSPIEDDRAVLYIKIKK